MKCPTCGNPVPRGAVVCPYCESPLSREARPKASLVKTVNIKEGDPPADVAADRMETILANAKASGTKVVIVIHGYGSGGTGGSIKEAVRKRLRSLKTDRRIRTFVFGENFGPTDDEAIRIAAEHQSLLAPHLFGAGNEGATIVSL
ncbi:MAG: hypothetical protein WBW88_15095 [Rhodothermales bacterium]